jgi:nicotinate-nucleotide adenylyltransferase
MQNICIFPGTFNPIHNAHLKMAEFALDNYKFDKIIFIPAYIPPHKEVSKDLASHRLEMVKLAISKNPKFELSDIEYKREGKSYSLLSVKEFIKEYKLETKLNFIIGTDAFVKINSWYKADELKKLVHFIVFPRRGDGNNEIYSELKNEGWDFELTTMDFIDISSTQIRTELENNKIDKKVEEYIKNNGLYKV